MESMLISPMASPVHHHSHLVETGGQVPSLL